MKKDFIKDKKDYFLLFFRVVVGVVFFLHGLAKVSMYTSGRITILSLLGIAMIIELIAGIMLVLGIFVRPLAVLTAIEMLVAYVKVHLPNNLNPLNNGGEASLLFLAIFVVMIAIGSGKYSLDRLFKKNQDEKNFNYKRSA